MLGIPDGDRLVVIASNFGRQNQPAWYHNLSADPAVTVTVDGVSRPYEAQELTVDVDGLTGGSHLASDHADCRST